MLLEILNDAVKEAMRNKEAIKRDALRAVVSDIKLASKEKHADLTEDEELALLNRQVKQVKESIDAYTAGGRLDLVEEEKVRLEALSAFLPQQMSEDEVRSLVKKTITEQGLDTSNKGLLMKNLMPLFKGKADGKMVNEVIGSFVK
ncbi:GatB/YqeY domain-containing protein [Niameybacter massiliensis]|uniref:GatB/YqeY domain-containing protein n=1 Tax=Holtiella tumoricola TaxID=3018743 RepID=A0AA42DK10_9FIRM|nr:GatB/YqeY domain-containing protein [Holtiella tumoricola]MDA3730462.1 GatB/YqeY domain-containing protein [Holtiella tumoricola]